MPRRFKIAGAIVLVVVIAVAYTQRVRLSETWEQWNRPSVPAVTFEEVTSDKRQETRTETEDVILSDDAGASSEGSPATTGDSSSPINKLGAPQNDIKNSSSPTPSTLPVSFNLAVPFTPQAPFANWDDVHEETCEEASLYMVHLYYQGTPEGLVAPATAEDALLKIVEAEKNLFGYFEDTTAEETARFIREYYGYARVDVMADPTVEDIKQHVAAGRPVIVPAAGRLLGNPYFTPPGPVYHMLVVRGYTPEGFIVNDPGTKRGEAYFYSFDAIMNAMHDWDPEEITDGRKAIIVIYPN